MVPSARRRLACSQRTSKTLPATVVGSRPSFEQEIEMKQTRLAFRIATIRDIGAAQKAIDALRSFADVCGHSLSFPMLRHLSVVRALFRRLQCPWMKVNLIYAPPTYAPSRPRCLADSDPSRAGSVHLTASEDAISFVSSLLWVRVLLAVGHPSGSTPPLPALAHARYLVVVLHEDAFSLLHRSSVSYSYFCSRSPVGEVLPSLLLATMRVLGWIDVDVEAVIDCARRGCRAGRRLLTQVLPQLHPFTPYPPFRFQYLASAPLTGSIPILVLSFSMSFATPSRLLSAHSSFPEVVGRYAASFVGLETARSRFVAKL
ncbi:hypothetical protein R3P38DRAFT_1774023 [Favolaschia claudopus]|uniref:Maturase n=1 Tax=Favolaschia claudopus TaxID=2862362 RepID=A0AAW0A6Y0_9AGAR